MLLYRLSLPGLAATPLQEVTPLPPQSQVSPGMLKSLPETAPAKAGEAGAPAAVMPRMPLPPPSRLQVLVQKGIFPADALNRATPFTRAEWADILVKALGHNRTLVNAFPFYRDVPPDYWAYVPIEVAREKKLIEFQAEHGDYHPEKPITYAEVYLAMAQAITGPPPTMEVQAHLMRAFTDREAIWPALTPAVTKMARSRLFEGPPGSGPPTPVTLHPNENVMPEGLAPLVSQLMRVIERRAPLRNRDESIAQALAPGLKLVVSPGTAIFESQLLPGERVFFTLTDAVEPLPKGSRLRGIVQQATPNHSYLVEFSEVQTPEGAFYQTLADLLLTFSAKEKLNFVVPGETFEIMTKEALGPARMMAVPPANGPNPSAVPPLTPSAQVVQSSKVKIPAASKPKLPAASPAP